MNRRRLGIVLATALVGLTAGCGGGSDPVKPRAEKGQAPLTLADFKTSPDQVSAGFEPPADLTPPDPSWDRPLTKLSRSMSGMLKASFIDRSVWLSNTDERTFGLVFAEFKAIDDKGDDVARALYDAARKDKKNVGRLGYRVGSTFPADAQPRDSFIYKVAWRTSVKDEVLTLEALAWSGYDTGGLQPVMVARKFKLSAHREAGTQINYGVSVPSWTTNIGICRAVVDGVLTPDDERLTAAAVDAYKAEFADPAFRPLEEAVQAIAKVDDDSISEEKSRARAQKCVDDAKETSAP